MHSQSKKSSQPTFEQEVCFTNWRITNSKPLMEWITSPCTRTASFMRDKPQTQPRNPICSSKTKRKASNCSTQNSLGSTRLKMETRVHKWPFSEEPTVNLNKFVSAGQLEYLWKSIMIQKRIGQFSRKESVSMNQMNFPFVLLREFAALILVSYFRGGGTFLLDFLMKYLLSLSPLVSLA